MRPIGKVRSPIVVVLLTIITLGIYGLYWHYAMFKETNDFDKEGINGIVGLLISLICTIITWFLLPAQVGASRERLGMARGVSAVYGLVVLIPFIGIFIWYFLIQKAANELWESQGASAA
ncbi:MAG: DUF4234 domain-containing protein [Acidimicrobiales bacterium]